MVKLVENELIKVIAKRRLNVIFLILVILIGLFAYGEHYTFNRTQERVKASYGDAFGDNWRALSEQQLKDLQRRLNNPYIPEEGKASLRVQISQLQFYLDNDISPLNSTAGKFMARFIEQAIFLFLPLLIILLASDMVSGELNTGTIKMLLTRPVPRWKILMNKWMALLILDFVVIGAIALICYVIAFFTFRLSGLNEPVMIGFKIVNSQLNTDYVRTIPQWQYLMMVYAIGYFIAVVIGSLSLAVSVFVKSTAASIGVMMASLIGGSFLSFFIADWEISKYLYTVNLNLTAYLSGRFQSIDGLTMLFSTLVLLAWAFIAMAAAFGHFIRKDMLA